MGSVPEGNVQESIMIKVISAITGFVLTAMATAVVDAAEIKVLCVGTLSHVYRDLIPEFERTSGHKVQ
jgi:ABC-type molybdate transport system substrate-binding protein